MFKVTLMIFLSYGRSPNKVTSGERLLSGIRWSSDDFRPYFFGQKSLGHATDNQNVLIPASGVRFHLLPHCLLPNRSLASPAVPSSAQRRLSPGQLITAPPARVPAPRITALLASAAARCDS
jgi:hypothetical protein